MKKLCEALLKAETAEKKATAKRIDLENLIFESIKTQLAKTEGSETLEIEGYGITINQPMVYKLDDEKYRVLVDRMPESLQIHRRKFEVDKKLLGVSLKNIQWEKSISDCVTIKPGKISVKVSVKK